MTSLTNKSKQVLQRLQAKANNNGRMPSLVSVHALLNELSVEHKFRSSRNVVEYRSKGRRFVNSRHNGKEGYLLQVGGVCVDSSESYYSVNSWNYARQLLDLLNVKD